MATATETIKTKFGAATVLPAGAGQLFKYRLNRQAAHRPEGGHGGVIKGYEDAGAGTYQLADGG